jgi:hypothetical protein
MEPFRIPIDPEKLSKEISCLEYPEFIEDFNDIGDKLNVDNFIIL